MGVRKYMKDPLIKGFFRDQKERIGEALDALDQKLPNQRKVVNGVTQRAWTNQGLKAEWDIYMNERFKVGVDRVHNDMDKSLPQLETKYAAPKYGGRKKHAVLGDAVTSLLSEWRKEKESKWEAAWTANNPVEGIHAKSPPKGGRGGMNAVVEVII